MTNVYLNSQKIYVEQKNFIVIRNVKCVIESLIARVLMINVRFANAPRLWLWNNQDTRVKEPDSNR